MSSGVKVHDEVKTTYSQISLKTAKQKKLKYAIFNFADDLKKIVVEKCGTHEDENSDYESIISSLPPNDVRYVAYDFDFISNDGAKTSKIIFISWHPETSPIKKKMLVASSLEACKLALNLSGNILEGDCIEEVSSKEALLKLGGKSLP